MLAEPAALARPGMAPPVARGWRLPLVPLGIIALFLIVAIVILVLQAVD